MVPFSTQFDWLLPLECIHSDLLLLLLLLLPDR
jgi:hypothetical protein